MNIEGVSSGLSSFLWASAAGLKHRAAVQQSTPSRCCGTKAGAAEHWAKICAIFGRQTGLKQYKNPESLKTNRMGGIA
ncbi:hypothetical protein [Mesorhizobium sp. M1143]|uniref:hypothetical protein n=1 Tax=Mesorhizobium sp. M1143 TaxID=2957061 RepID=UPI00333748F7